MKGTLQITLGLLFLVSSAGAEDQFDYTTNADGEGVTITYYSGPGGEVMIPASIDGLIVTAIGDFAFAYSYVITNVSIPTNVVSIGTFAFYFCNNMVSAPIPNGVTNIGGYAFADTGLTNLTLPTGVTTMWPAAFYECQMLTHLVIPYGVTTIGDDAFYKCYALTNVVISPTVNNYGDDGYAFAETGLQSITIANGVTNLGSWMF